MLFTRYGSLNATNYKNFKDKSTYHSPPVKKGIYAFPHGYESDFLWAWKVNIDRELYNSLSDEESDVLYKKELSNYIRQNKKIFNYDGPIWCHFTSIIQGETIGSWVLTDIKTYEKSFKKAKHMDINSLHETICSALWSGKEQSLNKENIIIDPYKRGLGGFMSSDYLEVFIEKKHLAKIR